MGRKAGFRSVCRSGTGYWRRPHWSNFDHTILPWQGCSQTEGVEDRCITHFFPPELGPGQNCKYSICFFPTACQTLRNHQTFFLLFTCRAHVPDPQSGKGCSHSETCVQWSPLENGQTGCNTEVPRLCRSFYPLFWGLTSCNDGPIAQEYHYTGFTV